MAKRQLAAERGAGGIYSGQGGDHLFHRRQSPLVAAEYVQRHGLGRNGFPIMLATARMAEQPLLSIFASALRFGVFRRRYDPYGGLRPPPFVSIEAATTPLATVREQIHHPWVRGAKHLPAAKCQQIADLVDTQCFSTASCTYADVVHPLISQPIIECCLRIPTYHLTHGGIERGLARAAFSNDLPAEIIERTAKGDATAYYHQLILQNLSAIREWLLDGWLVQERMLNRPLLEGALSEQALIDGYAEPYILAAMMAEAWARNAIIAPAQRRGSSSAQ
jgi:asparagine synthase (glutamine-hydrolysing)